MVKKFQLKNGLKVLLVESHKSPVVSVQMWVRTGSADEPPRLRGISHFIEHLVFKGSKKYGVGEIASVVEAAGGELNAYTSFDQTVFYVTMSRQFVDTGLDVIAEMMVRPTFVAEEIDREREVVIEEIKRSLDSSHRQASRLLFESLYPRHPYGEPVIGYEEIIRKVSQKEIVNYFESRYCAKNMTLVIVGDVTAPDLKPKLEALFADLPSHKVKAVRRPKETPLKRPRVEVRGSTFKENFLFLAWPCPPATHRDMAALEVLALILGQGDSSRLNRALRLDRELVNFAGSSFFSPQDPGFFSVSASLPPGALSPALEEIGRQLEQIVATEPTAEEIEKAIVNLHSEQYYTLETVDGMARKYGHFNHLFHDHTHFETFLKQARSLKGADIQAAAKKYLRVEKLVACALTPENESKKDLIILKSWLRELKNPAKAKAEKRKHKKPSLPKTWFPKPTAAQEKSSNQVEVVELSGGLRLLLRPDFDTPVMSMRLAFSGGTRLELKEQQGLTELLGRTWVTATKQRSEPELMAAIDALAGSLSAYGGRNTSGLSLSCLVPFADKMMGLLEEVLIDPDLKPAVIEREKKLMLEQLRVRHDNPTQVAIHTFTHQLFGDHPYGRDPLGRDDSIPGITGKSVLDHLHLMRTQKNLVASVTGHFSRETVVQQFERFAKQMPMGQRLLKPVAVAALSESKRCFSKSVKEQVHIVVGYHGLSFTDTDRYALQVLEAVLAGQGGRLFFELRDKNSLAYSVAPLRMEGVETGYFGAYIGCSPDKGRRALTQLRQQLADTAGTKIKANELSRAQRYLIGRHDIDLQRNSAMAANILFDDIYGIGIEETFAYAQRISEVTEQDVLRVAQRIFRGHEVVSAVGPTEPWDDGDRTKLHEANP